MAFPDGTPEKTSRFTAVSALVMRKYSTKVLSAGMYFPCLDSMITSFLFCGFGRARSCGSRAERIHAGRSPQLRSTLAGLTVLNPSPLKARKRGGCLVVTLTRPSGLGGSRTRAPRFRCRAKRQKGQTSFQDQTFVSALVVSTLRIAFTERFRRLGLVMAVH